MRTHKREPIRGVRAVHASPENLKFRSSEMARNESKTVNTEV